MVLPCLANTGIDQAIGRPGCGVWTSAERRQGHQHTHIIATRVSSQKAAGGQVKRPSLDSLGWGSCVRARSSAVYGGVRDWMGRSRQIEMGAYGELGLG